MMLTVTQSTYSGKRTFRSFFQHIVYSDIQKESLILNTYEVPNYFDNEDVQDRVKGGAILELIFDKDYEVTKHEQPANYFAHVPAWILRLVSSRSRNR